MHRSIFSQFEHFCVFSDSCRIHSSTNREYVDERGRVEESGQHERWPLVVVVAFQYYLISAHNRFG